MSESPQKHPYLTVDLPGIGGSLRTTVDDFVVEEVPAYPPCGEGEHVYLWIEKSELTTQQAIEHIAKALNISSRDIGSAGLKDKYARTRQYLSVPPPISPEDCLRLELPSMQILQASRHTNKLKTGHLRGNRFALVIRDLACDTEEAGARARAILEALAAVPFAPNWYGPQRFGRGGDNAKVGKALVLGEKNNDSRSSRRRPPRGKQRRLYISAYQSYLFNRYLLLRMERGLLGTVLPGDILQKRDSGGVFSGEDPSEEQGRLDAGMLAITGPMPGHKTRMPAEGSASAALEAEILDAEGIRCDDFRHLGKLAMGTRRPLTVPITNHAVRVMDNAIEVAFELPSGSYATAIMREILKGERDFPE